VERENLIKEKIMGTIRWDSHGASSCTAGEIVEVKTGKSILIQRDLDYPCTANTFGWSTADVIEPCAHFNRFDIAMPIDAVSECSHQGDCGPDVEEWAKKIERPEECTVDALREELREYGAWDDEQLSDDAANWERIVWIAAGDIQERSCAHEKTDGTVDCPDCGVSKSDFIIAARNWLDENGGATVDDPGYF
jgi:hypothetical protein